MQRNQAISKASKFLGRKHHIKTGSSAKVIKDRAKDNPDLNRARLNNIIGDIYQRGVDPKDLDLEKIDWSVSYQNIRGQVKDLLDRRGADSFAASKRREREATQDYAAKKQSEQLMTVAEVRDERRPAFNQYIDKTKNAEKTFGRLTEKAFNEWSRNPNKYDVEGVDTRDEEEFRGMQMGLPFQRKSKDSIRDMRLSNAEQDLGGDRSPGAAVNPGELVERNLGVSSSEILYTGDEMSKHTSKRIREDRQELMDSRSSDEVEQDMKGGTSERSEQKGLREQGFASKSSEKTLGDWDEFK